VWFTLDDYVNIQNNRYWRTENPCTIHEVPVGHGGLLDPCSFFFSKTINSEHYVRLILSPFFDQLTNEENLNRHVMQDNAMAHSVHNALDRMFGR
jgi:hypothetical protein